MERRITFHVPMRPSHSASRSTVVRSREMRKEPTYAEARLWSDLQRRQIEGFKFRRQVPMGPYFVDFVCFKARLVIEVDGSQHRELSVEEHDARRTAWLTARGFRVLRFWNEEVLLGMAGVWEVIRTALKESRSELEPSNREGRLQTRSRGSSKIMDGSF
jgi:very-short-patch-repair endonuclease